MSTTKNAGVFVKSLKILMIAPEPWFQPRGTPFSVLHRIKALTMLGHQVDLATYPFGENVSINGLRIYRSAKIPFVKNVKVGPSVTKALLDIPLFVLVCSLLRRRRYDCLHTHEEASFIGTLITRVTGIPHVYDMHSSLPQQLKNFKFTDSALLIKLFRRLEEITLMHAAGIITICPELQNYVQKAFPYKKSILIENVADNNLVFQVEPVDERQLRQQYNLNNGRIVLYYGTFEPYQGIDLLIQSAEYLNQQKFSGIHFLLVGGSGKQVSTYQQMVHERGLRHFTFTGYVPPGVIPSLVSIADVLVSPRLGGSNSPLKIYSYLRSGKPIVATRHIAHTQILNDQVAVLAEPTPIAFAEAIRTVLSDRRKSIRMVSAAKKLASKNYNYQTYLKKTEWLVGQVIGSS